MILYAAMLQLQLQSYQFQFLSSMNSSIQLSKLNTSNTSRVVSAGVGYRLLKEGEVILRGDEYLSSVSGQWEPRSSAIGGRQGSVGSGWCPTRRADAGEGYRFLKDGETILRTDQGIHPMLQKWMDMPLGAWGNRYDSTRMVMGRRKVETNAAAPAPAKATVERKPEPRVFAGEGYRFLREGETFVASDEAIHTGSRMDHHDGFKVQATTSATYPEGYYRRKVEAPKVETKAPAKAAPVAGYGFRLLASHEVIQKGDSYDSGRDFISKCECSIGMTVAAAQARWDNIGLEHVRRSVKAPAGFRLLEATEIVKDGDRYLTQDGADAQGNACVCTVGDSAQEAIGWLKTITAFAIIRPVEAVKAEAPKPKTYEVKLTLTQKQAEQLRDFGIHVGGIAETTARGAFDQINRQLEAMGVSADYASRKPKFCSCSDTGIHFNG